MEKPRLDREVIAMRVALELQDGDVVNLGLGIPTLCSQFIPEGRSVMYHSESGVLNYGPMAEPGEEDIDLINAGGQFLAMSPGMSFFSSADAFAMIRGGHVDVAVLGALQVSERGDLANWMLPERGVGQRGRRDGPRRRRTPRHRRDGAHRPQRRASKLVRECAYPPTAMECVSLVVTDIAVVEIGPGGAVLTEVAPGWTAEEVLAQTDAHLSVSPQIKEITL